MAAFALVLGLGACSSSRDGQVGSAGKVEVLAGHTDAVVGLTALDDGRLASVADDGDIRVWDLTASSVDLTIKAGLSKVAAMDQLQDGRLITASPSGAEIWDLWPAPAPVRIPDSRSTYSVAVLSDGTIAVGDANGTVRIWNPNDLAEPLVAYRQHAAAGRPGALVNDVVELSDGTIASSAAGEVHIWDRRRPMQTLAASGPMQRELFSITELSDGWFASAGTNGWVYLWDTSQPNSNQLGFPEPGFYTDTDVIELDRDLVASRGNHVWLWSPSEPSKALAAYERDNSTALALLPDGRLAVGYYDGEIHLWDPGLGS